MRVRCCVPLCKRTRMHVTAPVCVGAHIVDFGAEWICQKHWGAVPTTLRQRHAAAKREVKRSGTLEAYEASDAIWTMCKAVATEIAYGIA